MDSHECAESDLRIARLAGVQYRLRRVESSLDSTPGLNFAFAKLNGSGASLNQHYQHLKRKSRRKMKRFGLVTAVIVSVAAATLRPQTPQDIERARDVLAILRRAPAKYRNSRVALSEGYRIFLPTIPQEVYHFTFYPAAAQECAGHFNPARPGSLLYAKNSRGEYVLVGAMYSAPPEYTLDQLDEMIPLSVAHWHAHVNICLPNGITLNDLLRGDIGTSQVDMPGMIPVASNPAAAQINQRLGFLADGRFGFHGKIADAAACESAGGHFIPQAFGWMVHVYPFNGRRGGPDKAETQLRIGRAATGPWTAGWWLTPRWREMNSNSRYRFLNRQTTI